VQPSASQAHKGRVSAALQAATELAKSAVTLAAREHAQAGGEELTQLMRAVAESQLDAAGSAAQQAQLTRALESLAGSSQRTEALLSKGLAALQQIAEGLRSIEQQHAITVGAFVRERAGVSRADVGEVVRVDMAQRR
jgi:hypothetical protein